MEQTSEVPLLQYTKTWILHQQENSHICWKNYESQWWRTTQEIPRSLDGGLQLSCNNYFAKAVLAVVPGIQSKHQGLLFKDWIPLALNESDWLNTINAYLWIMQNNRWRLWRRKGLQQHWPPGHDPTRTHVRNRQNLLLLLYVKVACQSRPLHTTKQDRASRREYTPSISSASPTHQEAARQSRQPTSVFYGESPIKPKKIKTFALYTCFCYWMQFADVGSVTQRFCLEGNYVTTIPCLLILNKGSNIHTKNNFMAEYTW
jgi:hypothetical protein